MLPDRRKRVSRGNLRRGSTVWDDVSSSTTADGVDWSMVLVEKTVTFELLIKGEHGALSLGLGVANSTTAAEEDRGGRGRHAGSRRGGAKGARAQAAIVACTTTTGMVVSTGIEDGRTFGDLDGHCNGFFYRDVGWMIVDDGIKT